MVALGQEHVMKFICIGKNYMAHAREMGGELPEEPMFFFKPENAVPLEPDLFIYPEFSSDVHHEVELAVLIDLGGRNIPEAEAFHCYSQVSVGIDFTARDFQRRQKRLGFPWEICKAFEGSAPVGKWVALDTLNKGIQELPLSLTVNGEIRQEGNTSDMIFPVDSIIAHVSRFVTLDPGDILLTGTPEGVGPVEVGDELIASLAGEELLQVTVVADTIR